MLLTSLVEAWDTAAMFRTCSPGWGPVCKAETQKKEHPGWNSVFESPISGCFKPKCNWGWWVHILESATWRGHSSTHPRTRHFAQPRLEGYIQIPARKHGSERRLSKAAVPLPPRHGWGKLCCFPGAFHRFRGRRYAFVLHSLIWDFIFKKTTKPPKTTEIEVGYFECLIHFRETSASLCCWQGYRRGTASL